MIRSHRQRLLLIFVVLTLSACGQVLSREDLITAVVGKSEQEVTQQLGKPDAVEDSNSARVTWTYNRKTFDLEHQNKVDSKAMLLFERDKGGNNRRVTKVDFVP